MAGSTILDLQGLNTFLKVLPFRMLGMADVLQSVAQEAWFLSIDLIDAYFHVAIAPHHRQFLRFTFQGRAYQFKVMPSGLSLAPRIFTRCVAAALAPIQARGLMVLPYLDDWLIVSPTVEQAVKETAVLLGHVTQLGLSQLLQEQSYTQSEGRLPGHDSPLTVNESLPFSEKGGEHFATHKLLPERLYCDRNQPIPIHIKKTLKSANSGCCVCQSVIIYGQAPQAAPCC